MTAVHDHDRNHVDRGSLRPKAARLDDPESLLQMRAALSGRLDTVTPRGVLGRNELLATRLPRRRSRSARQSTRSSPSLAKPWSTTCGKTWKTVLATTSMTCGVHSDSAADASVRSLNANAYTVGSHIVFQRSAFAPASKKGRTPLAHELTHVMQQGNGPVEGTPAASGISVSDPSGRFEREAVATAERAM